MEFLSPFGSICVQIFLEFQLTECDNNDSELHTKLALMYVETIKAILPNAKINPVPGTENGLLGVV